MDFKRGRKTEQALNLGSDRLRSKIENIKFEISYVSNSSSYYWSNLEWEDFDEYNTVSKYNFWKNIAFKMKETERKYYNQSNYYNIYVTYIIIGNFSKSEREEMDNLIGRKTRLLKEIKIENCRNFKINV